MDPNAPRNDEGQKVPEKQEQLLQQIQLGRFNRFPTRSYILHLMPQFSTYRPHSFGQIISLSQLRGLQNKLKFGDNNKTQYLNILRKVILPKCAIDLKY